MQLQVSFMTLLAGIFVILSNTHTPANALPLSEKENRGVVVLPLKRIPLPRDVHPQILLQQHINRSRRRLARMTGRDAPSTEELEHHLKRRVISIEGPEGLQKRYNRQGVPKPQSKSSSTKVNNEKVQLGSDNLSGSEGQTGDVRGNRHSQQGNDGERQGGQATDGNSGNTSNKGTKGGATAAGAGGAGGSEAGQGTNSSGNSRPGAGTGNADSAGTGAVLADVTEANPPTAGDSLGLDIEAQDTGYLATIQMGTPPRNFLILMDSGSADLWVGGENCQTEGVGSGCGDHNFLGTQSSSTFVDTNKPFSVTYGTGSVSGTIVKDNVGIAGLNLSQHVFGVATQESTDFSDNTTPFDGLMGLAKSALSEQNTPTPIESLASQGLVKAAVIGYKISRLADNKNDGEITFGGTDPTKFDAATVVDLANVNPQGFWEAAMDAVSVNGTDLGLTGRTAILDTGTTLIVAPSADAQTVHDAIPGAKSDSQGGFTVPCTTTASVALTFGGTAFAIDSRDIAFQPVDANDPTGDCTSGISVGEIGADTEWLVGDVFLKNAYFSTDVGNNKLSLAKLV